LGIYKKKYSIHCPIIDTVTPLCIYIQQLSSLLAKSWHIAAGLWIFSMLQKSYRQLLYRRDREQSPKYMHTTVQLLMHSDTTFGRLNVAPEAGNRGAPNLELKVQRVYSTD